MDMKKLNKIVRDEVMTPSALSFTLPYMPLKEAKKILKKLPPEKRQEVYQYIYNHVILLYKLVNGTEDILGYKICFPVIPNKRKV